MTDCLKSNLSVQEPVYCEDESGNIIPDTAMYSWMAVRAAGPNVLKDTTLCGETQITEPLAPNQAFYQMYLFGEQANESAAVMPTTAAAVGTWVPFGNDNYPTRLWTVKFQSSQTNVTFNIFDEPPTPFPPGAIGVVNSNNRDIVARLTLTASVRPIGVVNTPYLAVGLWQSQVSATPLASNASIQSVLASTDLNDTYTFTCDFITIMKPDDLVQPVIRFTSGGTIASYDIVAANLVAEFIEYYKNDGGDDVLPGGVIPPPPPPV